MLGKTVGQYRISKKIGAGGMGVVYLAEHTLLGRPAAVKTLLPEFSQDRVVVSRFFNEARAATSIRHPGIVEIYDFGFEPDGSAYIVMEYLEGETLTKRAKRGLLSHEGAVAIIRQIASALAAAHAKGIIHRDLKPDNVFLVPDPDVFGGERIKLLDFGIAKLTADPPADRNEAITRNGDDDGENGHEGSSLTRTGTVMGTPAYMSPEQCRGIPVDHRTDLYSLGCILFRLCAGKPPFTGAGVGDILAAHIHVPPPLLSSVRPGVPAEIDRLVQRLLVKDPAQRLGSAEEVIQEIELANSSPAYRTSAQMPGIFHPPAPPPAHLPASSTSPGSVPGLSAALAGIEEGTASGASRSMLGTAPSRPSARQPSAIPSVAELPTMNTLSEGVSAGSPPTTMAPVRSRRGVWAAAAAVVAAGGIAAAVLLGSGGASREGASTTTTTPSAADSTGAAPSADATSAAAAANPAAPPAPAAAGDVAQSGAKTAEGDRASGEATTPEAAAAATVGVTITSVPAGAAVSLDGEPVGKTPYTASWPRGEAERAVLLRLSGYEDRALRVSPRGDISERVKLVKRESKRGGGKKREGKSDKKTLDKSYNPFGN